MIEELIWDSQLFNRKIGELKIQESLLNIENAIKKGQDDGFKYLICRIPFQQEEFARQLESFGFYLTDIGVTWTLDIRKFQEKDIENITVSEKDITIATSKDVHRIKKIAKSLFKDSRFYSDPFFSKDEADRCFDKWIENSVEGITAEVVFYLPDIAFVTCKKISKNRGSIILIGVKKGFSKKGIGTMLIKESIKWFKKQDIHWVNARTQLKNLNAMNFYSKLCFFISEYDVIFAKVL